MSYTPRPTLPRSGLGSHPRIRRKQLRRHAVLLRERQLAKRARMLEDAETAIAASFGGPDPATPILSASNTMESTDASHQLGNTVQVVSTTNTPPPTPPGSPPPTPPPTRPPSPGHKRSLIVTLKMSKPFRPSETPAGDRTIHPVAPLRFDPPPRPPLRPVPTPKPSGNPPPNAPPPSPVQAHANDMMNCSLEYLDLATDQLTSKMQKVLVSEQK